MRDLCYSLFAYIFFGGGIIFLIFSLLALNGNKILFVEYGLKSFKSEMKEKETGIYDVKVDKINKKMFWQLLISSIIDFVLFFIIYTRNKIFPLIKSDVMEQMRSFHENIIIDNNINKDNNIINNINNNNDIINNNMNDIHQPDYS